MKVKVSAYEHLGKGVLKFIDKKDCDVQAPIAKKGCDPRNDYISFNFGKYHLHIDKDDFSKLCKSFTKFFMYNREGS